MKDWRKEQDMFYGMRDTLTEEQADYLDSIQENRMTLSDSVSGSGKTTLAVAMAHYNGYKLIYVFFPVEEGAMGFRPGNQQAKDSAYYGPLLDALSELNVDPSRAIKYEEEELQTQWKSMANKTSSEAWVQAMPHVFLRGRNLGKGGETIVIIDETQNGTKAQIKKTISRIHDDAIVIVIGHNGQIDLADPKQSGFKRTIEHFSTKWYAKVVNLTHNFRGEMSRDADDL